MGKLSSNAVRRHCPGVDEKISIDQGPDNIDFSFQKDDITIQG